MTVLPPRVLLTASALLLFSACHALSSESATALNGETPLSQESSEAPETRKAHALPPSEAEALHVQQPAPRRASRSQKRSLPRSIREFLGTSTASLAGSTDDTRGADMGPTRSISLGERRALAPAPSVMSAPQPRPAQVVGPQLAGGPATEDGNRFRGVPAHPFTQTREDHLSTFSIDVDTASYAISRRYLTRGQLPPADAVRVEEFLNSFSYAYPAPTRGAFSVHLEGAPSPFTKGRTLLKVGLQGRHVTRADRKPANLVFLIDTSGSMAHPDRLPVAVQALKLLVKNLNEHDTIAITTYASGSRDVLPPTPATEYARIHAALDSLTAHGGTAMGTGLTTAYAHAMKGAGSGRNSRVIVLTDGDANLGPNLTHEAMLESVKAGVAEGVTLTTIGLGMGNYRDDLLEQLANRGNGNAFYIDSMREAERVFGTHLTGTLEVIAKDVKIQVEFDPAAVAGHRLLGYENRALAHEDFRDDKVDAGEIGAGHSVTALYEVELTGVDAPLATVRVRAKTPTGTEAAEQTFTFGRDRLSPTLESASDDLRFAAAVAMTADVLRIAPGSESISLPRALVLARGSVGRDRDRAEFVTLLERTHELTVRRAQLSEARRNFVPPSQSAY